MKIKSMKLRDFLSFEKVDLKLHNTHDEPPSIFLVVGKNYDQSEDSDESRNGAGKSSFLCENLSYNLFGKPLRGGKGKVKIDDLIRKGQDDMVNEISYFLEDGSELLISRSRNEKGINDSTKLFPTDGAAGGTRREDSGNRIKAAKRKESVERRHYENYNLKRQRPGA